jgi:hypothetical protein
MAWTTVGSIKGPPGDKGDPGDPGTPGSSAYQLAVAGGYSGTQSEWLASLKGPQGDPGEPGQDGTSIEIAGSVQSYADLPTTLTTANAGDGYLVKDDGLLYMWDGDSFPANGAGVQFRGPKGDTGSPGDPGSDGASAYSIAVDNGFVGTQAQWLASLVGAKGDTGNTGQRGSKWFVGAGVPSGVSGSIAGDMYLDSQTGNVYQLS